MIRDALKDVLGVNWRVRCEHGGGPVDPAPPTAPAATGPDPADVARAEDSMIAEVNRRRGVAPRRDPEEVALNSCRVNSARRIDG